MVRRGLLGEVSWWKRSRCVFDFIAITFYCNAINVEKLFLMQNLFSITYCKYIILLIGATLLVVYFYLDTHNNEKDVNVHCFKSTKYRNKSFLHTHFFKSSWAFLPHLHAGVNYGSKQKSINKNCQFERPYFLGIHMASPCTTRLQKINP